MKSDLSPQGNPLPIQSFRETLDDLIQQPQYSVPQAEKEAVLLAELTRLGKSHRERSPEYARLARVLFPGSADPHNLAELPYLPVGLFKEHLLSSVPESEIFKILQSSGTTGQTPSRVVLDRETAQLQTLALSRIMTSVLGPNRLPMILVESADLIRDRRQFNARAAGLLGMINFGRNHFYALDTNLELLGVCLSTKIHRQILKQMESRSVAPKSSAPASDVIAPASNAATTARPSTGSNPSNPGDTLSASGCSAN